MVSHCAVATSIGQNCISFVLCYVVSKQAVLCSIVIVIHLPLD